MCNVCTKRRLNYTSLWKAHHKNKTGYKKENNISSWLCLFAYFGGNQFHSRNEPPIACISNLFTLTKNCLLRKESVKAIEQKRTFSYRPIKQIAEAKNYRNFKIVLNSVSVCEWNVPYKAHFGWLNYKYIKFLWYPCKSSSSCLKKWRKLLLSINFWAESRKKREEFTLFIWISFGWKIR